MPKSGGVYRLYCVVRNGAAGGRGKSADQGRRPGVAPQAGRGPAARWCSWAATQRETLYPLRLDGQREGDPHGCRLYRIPRRQDLHEVHLRRPGWLGRRSLAGPGERLGADPGGYDLSQPGNWVLGPRPGGGERSSGRQLGTATKYHDSPEAQRDLTLTSKWQQYTFDLGEKDLSRIKSGFLWSLAGQGKPVTFYLDNPIQIAAASSRDRGRVG